LTVFVWNAYVSFLFISDFIDFKYTMAQVGQEIVDRPSPGQPADNDEALEEVKHFS
jgi:hypothetical protein